MEITLSLVGDIPILHLLGRLDASSAPALEERINLFLAEGGQKLVFDCQALDYISSAGLRVFITTLRTMKSRGGLMAVASLQKPVREIFHLAGLEELFILGNSKEEAASLLG